MMALAGAMEMACVPLCPPTSRRIASTCWVGVTFIFIQEAGAEEVVEVVEVVDMVVVVEVVVMQVEDVVEVVGVEL